MESSAPSHDKRWEKFLVSILLESLREAAAGKFQNDLQEYEGSKSAAKKAGELSKVLLTKKGSSANSTLASANTFIGGVAGKLGDFLSGMKLMGRFKDGSEISNETLALMTRNVRVESALSYCEDRLRFLLPDLTDMDENRWPGHISYRAGLNHFVAVCLRVHSILPDVPFDDVTYAAARRILVPALAHNLKFFAKSHPELYRKFVHDDAIKLRAGLRLKVEEAVAGLPGESRYLARKWARLFNVSLDFMQEWEITKVGQLYIELQSLLRDYEADPRSSRLWRDLSILAAGDMAVDEMLVSWVIKDVGGGAKDKETAPLISCARSRLGLLRYAYLMGKESDKIREDFASGLASAQAAYKKLKACGAQKASDEHAKLIFGWAYILSRHNLLGRNHSTQKLDDKRYADAATLLFDLLNTLRLNAADETYRALALRYLVGFMTNPRFVKPLEKIRQDPRNIRSQYMSTNVDGLIKDAESLAIIPRSVVCLAYARMALYSAHDHRQDSDRAARDLQAALDHYGSILKQVDSPAKAGNMDSEVIAWALPEMYYAVGLFAAHDVGSQHDWRKVQESLQLLGELQYGVFFNAHEESKRIAKGLELTVG